ncbi:unnamed protein product [Soboliphyme baturini]|uniref:C2H2-type domain-containing protein n=1 Tax=Soboliphyme baturini TaxID=241478 RepID=A0A183IJV5_9BILA|nr:unnamed protein product [Soboliphyme baturini]
MQIYIRTVILLPLPMDSQGDLQTFSSSVKDMKWMSKQTNNANCSVSNEQAGYGWNCFDGDLPYAQDPAASHSRRLPLLNLNAAEGGGPGHGPGEKRTTADSSSSIEQRLFLCCTCCHRIKPEELEKHWLQFHRPSGQGTQMFCIDCRGVIKALKDLRTHLTCFQRESTRRSHSKCSKCHFTASCNRSLRRHMRMFHQPKYCGCCGLEINGKAMEQLEKFKYLGVLFTSDGKFEEKIDRRIRAASCFLDFTWRQANHEKKCYAQRRARKLQKICMVAKCAVVASTDGTQSVTPASDCSEEEKSESRTSPMEACQVSSSTVEENVTALELLPDKANAETFVNKNKSDGEREIIDRTAVSVKAENITESHWHDIKSTEVGDLNGPEVKTGDAVIDHGEGSEEQIAGSPLSSSMANSASQILAGQTFTSVDEVISSSIYSARVAKKRPARTPTSQSSCVFAKSNFTCTLCPTICAYKHSIIRHLRNIHRIADPSQFYHEKPIEDGDEQLEQRTVACQVSTRCAACDEKDAVIKRLEVKLKRIFALSDPVSYRDVVNGCN